MSGWFRRWGRDSGAWSIWAAHALAPEDARALSLDIRGATFSRARRETLPEQGALVLDERWIAAPGLINAHDHLELNSFPLLGWNRPYGNYYQWVEDVRSRWDSEPLCTARLVKLTDRLRLGGLKNLLNGVTTLCHHNPYHRCMGGRFPVHVLKNCAFLQSLESPDPAELRQARRSLAPLFVHVADGTDARAQAEFELLQELFSGRPKLVLVHGLGLTDAQIETAAREKCSHVWCPVSNDYLYNSVAPMEKILPRMCAALGSDSALSGSQGLLDDLRFAAQTNRIEHRTLTDMVTRQAAQVLGLQASAGCLAAGCQADLLVVPRTAGSLQESLLGLRRSEIGLVVRRGRPVYGSPEFQQLFRQHRIEVIRIQVDGCDKILDASLPIPWNTLDRVRCWTPLWQGIVRHTQPAPTTC